MRFVRSSLTLILFLFAGPVVAQQATADHVTVQRISPQDLPKPEESAIPAVLGKAEVMPRMPKADEILSMQKRVALTTHRVYVAVKPLSSLQRDPIVMEGHAVWLSAKPDGSDPVLVTPAHWVDGAERIMVAPRQAFDAAAQVQSKRATLDAMTLRAQQRKLDDPTLMEARVVTLDRGRNLAVLSSDDPKFKVPDAGLGFFPVASTALSFMYVVSPYSDYRPATARFVEDKNKDESLLFYLIVDAIAAPGAPLMAASGELVAMIGMAHPTDGERSLTIPPLAAQRFVRVAQNLDAPQLVTDVPSDASP